jgi:predicted lipoprotein with Yx(FWY)xxD motif
MTRNQRTHGSVAIPARSLILVSAVVATIATLGFGLINTPAGNAAGENGPVIRTASTSLGKMLVDSRGRAVYLFQKDRNGTSACKGQCASFWPPVIASGKPVAGPGVKASLLGTTKRADGRLQVTYDHHPLYTFAQDTKKGQTSGEGVSAFGAKWFVVSTAGVAIVKAPTSPGGYSYG